MQRPGAERPIHLPERLLSGRRGGALAARGFTQIVAGGGGGGGPLSTPSRRWPAVRGQEAG